MAAACLVALFALGQDAAAPQQTSALDQVVDKMAAREAEYIKTMRKYTPLIETYLQEMEPNAEFGEVPKNDWYHLSRLSLADQKIDVSSFAYGKETPEKSATPEKKGFFNRAFSGFGGSATKLLSLGKAGGASNYGYIAAGFDSMVLVDTVGLTRDRYEFKFVRREFLGDLRTIVLDVTPRTKKGEKQNPEDVRFLGRLWLEDIGYNIVRVNGTFTPAPKKSAFFHFDAWRLNMGPDLWLPAYIYSEESGVVEDKKGLHYNFKGQTRVWGYDVTRPANNDELTAVLVDAPNVQDQSATQTDAGPVASTRQWEREAEDNILERLQKLGLVSPPGEVDKVLETVVNNIEVTNNVEVQPEIRCRVLMTAPLESFNIGHTIVVSRGFLDTLPDEASLAAVLAHEMGHILLSHKIDTKYAFSDRMLFPDNQAFQRIDVKHTPQEEKEADDKAVELLQNSPYKDKLGGPGLFLAALQARSPALPNLLTANMGSSLQQGITEIAKREKQQSAIPPRAPAVPAENAPLRMSALQSSAPQLVPGDVKQIAALPLNGRIKVDPWSDRLEMSKSKGVPLLSAREKMPFEITPIRPYLMRQGAQPAPTPAATAPPAPAPSATAPAAATPAAKTDNQPVPPAPAAENQPVN